jgi:hypothetical protein
VVERALAEQVSWEIKRMQGLAAIDLIYREEGYPTAEERAEATARVVEEERLADEAAAANAAKGWKPPWLTAQWPGDSGSGLGAA